MSKKHGEWGKKSQVPEDLHKILPILQNLTKKNKHIVKEPHDKNQ